MANSKLLWIDDEIEMLRAPILFLEQKGYQVVKASNGSDAIDLNREEHCDLILLDERLHALPRILTLHMNKE